MPRRPWSATRSQFAWRVAAQSLSRALATGATRARWTATLQRHADRPHVSNTDHRLGLCQVIGGVVRLARARMRSTVPGGRSRGVWRHPRTALLHGVRRAQQLPSGETLGPGWRYCAHWARATGCVCALVSQRATSHAACSTARRARAFCAVYISTWLRSRCPGPSREVNRSD